MYGYIYTYGIKPIGSSITTCGIGCMQIGSTFIVR